METDAGFFEIFETNPDRLAELTGLDLPKFNSASSQALKKTTKVECGLLFEPVSATEPHWIVEIQMYFDHSIFNRPDMARALVWKNRNRRKDCALRNYDPYEVRGLVIFGDQSMLPPNTERHQSINYHFLDELVEKLKQHSPQSPLIAVLAPLFQSDEELEQQAATYYGSIKDNANIHPDERIVLSDVFIHFISQRFKHLTIDQILKMIAELTPIEETQLGKELIEKGIEKGIETNQREVAQNMSDAGMKLEEIAKMMKLTVEQIKALGITD